MRTKWIFVFLIALLSLLKTEAVNESFFETTSVPREIFVVKNYRLPKAILPKHYNLSLEFDDNFSFRGSVQITAIVYEKTDKIVLHYGKINILTTNILLNNRELEWNSTNYDSVTEKYSIKLNEVLRENSEILIEIDFFGDCQNGAEGLYKITYVEENGEKKKMAATQFQPVHARHAFPCFDEPAFKAIFEINILRPEKYITLSNMPLRRSIYQGTDVIDYFEESVKMSTYLVAFIVSDLKSIGNDIIKVWTREEVIDQAEYALKIGEKSIEYLEIIFGQKYQLEKLDMVALPKTYFGGMENWGLITFRESSFLFNEIDSSAFIQQEIASTIAHECVHMWFGNSVTPDWWGYLWLSEAFANLYQYKTISQIEPTWNMDEQILLMQQKAFFLDSLSSAEPMSRDVITQSEIIGMADGITYDKGASILRMMELSFGSDIFKSAVQSYLDARQYDIGKPEDFFARIQIQITSKLDASVETIMNTWTKQSGYPVLSVIVTGDQVKLEQKPFYLRNLNLESGLNKKWWIPITWASKSKPTFSLTTTDKWIKNKKIIKVEREKNDWIIFNVQSAGFYRVNYDTESWNRIIYTLRSNNFETIDVLNRAAIIDDLMNLARANLLDYDIALEGLYYLKNETNYLPFKSGFNSLGYLTRRFTGQPEFKTYYKYVFRLMNKIHPKVGFIDRIDDDRYTLLLRRELNWLSCNLGLPDCVDKSLKYFKNWKNGLNARVPKNLKQVVYATAIKKGSSDDWTFLWNVFKTTNSISEKVEILSALSCTQDSNTLNQFLQTIILDFDKYNLQKRDMNTVFSSVLSCSSFGVEAVLDFIDEYHGVIADSNGGDYEQVLNILSEASQYSSTKHQVDKFRQIIQSHYIDFETILTSLKSQLELAEFELNWYELNSKKISDWIKNQNHQYRSENPFYIISV